MVDVLTENPLDSVGASFIVGFRCIEIVVDFFIGVIPAKYFCNVTKYFFIIYFVWNCR